MWTSWMSSRFIEASIAYYRGKPIMTDGDYKELRAMPALAELLNGKHAVWLPATFLTTLFYDRVMRVATELLALASS